MVVGQFSQDVDILVIGGGPAGYTAAFRCAELGQTVAIVDPRETLGGACLHQACIPSKSSIFEVDSASAVAKLRKGLEQKCTSLGIDRLRGYAHFENKKTVQVTGEVVSVVKFRKAIIASGSLPRVDSSFANAVQIEELYATPPTQKKILIVGNTPSAVESATVLQRENTVSVWPEGGILPSFEPQFVKLVSRNLNILTKAPPSEEFDIVALASHRAPAIETLQLSNANVAVEGGCIQTDSSCATSNPKVYAVGECAGCSYSAALAIAQGRVGGESACDIDAELDACFVPLVVLGEPEIAQVGDFQDETVTLRWGSSGLAVALGQHQGVTTIGYEKDTQAVTGIGMCGVGATELISEGVLALEMGATLYDSASTIHPHPTKSELLCECARLALASS